MYFITANEAIAKYTGWLIAKAITIAMLAIATPIPQYQRIIRAFHNYNFQTKKNNDAVRGRHKKTSNYPLVITIIHPTNYKINQAI